MSITELKAKRDAIETEGIGIYLEVVKWLFAAIDEHVASSIELQARAGQPEDTK